MRPLSKLGNCYIPLPLSIQDGITSSTGSAKQGQHRHRPLQDIRGSGDPSRAPRATHELRRLYMAKSFSSSAVDRYGNSSSQTEIVTGATTGFCQVELGRTKVLCHVNAPIPSSSDILPPSLEVNMEEGTLLCEVRFASHWSTTCTSLIASSVSVPSSDSNAPTMNSGRITAVLSRREAKLSQQLHAALASSVPLQQYAKCVVRISVTVLQDDGSLLPACITAASMALMDANVEVYDVVTACRVAVFVSQPPSQDQAVTLLADPDVQEERHADAVMTLALLPNWKEVTLWEHLGPLSPSVANQAMELCLDGCRTMHRFVTTHWHNRSTNTTTTF